MVFCHLILWIAQQGYGSAHDKLDAFMAAWVASLPEDDVVPCGDPPNDVIWIPKRKPVHARSTAGADQPELGATLDGFVAGVGTDGLQLNVQA